jgi:hypothetical protein
MGKWTEQSPTTDKWINKMRYLYTNTEFYSATKKNEILSLEDELLELENIILNEISLTQKVKTTFSLICGI